MKPVIVWFGNDLRLADNPALGAALATGRPMVPVHVLDEGEAHRPLGGAARWWLHGSLAALGAAVERAGGRLILRRGGSADCLMDVARTTGADAVYRNRAVDPAGQAVEAAVRGRLAGGGVAWREFGPSLLFDPGAVAGRAGRPLRVFTPYWRACLALGEPAPPLPAPERLPAVPPDPESDRLDDWNLRPSRPDWAHGLRKTWRPGENAARARLDRFLDDGLATYGARRDRLDWTGTSRLSPHLRFGEISPRQIWHAVRAAAIADPTRRTGAESFLRELGWREFAHQLLALHSDLATVPIQSEFARFPWNADPAAARAWQRGRTGYPVVDAAMRELWRTGWMHNRGRMIAASFLVKHLLIPWQAGEAWFWDTLVDADPANNGAGWQWVAGCGADAAPYFRIFNPVLQGEKFDPTGAYVRRWVPELARLPDRFAHRPWEAPPAVLAEVGLRFGETYPRPIVDHRSARERALTAFRTIRQGAGAALD